MTVSFVTVFLFGIFFNFGTASVAHAGRIIDGIEYNEKFFPNVARLFDQYGQDHCTGTLIDHNHVLTAAHCFFEPNDRGSRSVLGADMRVRLNGQIYQSKQVYIHPAYQNKIWGCSEGQVDAAIIELTKDVPNITPAPLFTDRISVGTEVTIAGYGLAGLGNEYGDLPQPFLQLSTPPIGKIYAGTTIIEGFGRSFLQKNPDSTYVYWYFNEGDSNTAPGDSGGPAFLDNKLVAITCGGLRPSQKYGVSSVDTRIDIMAGWIKDVLSGKVKPTADPKKPEDPLCSPRFPKGGGDSLPMESTFGNLIKINSDIVCGGVLFPNPYYNTSNNRYAIWAELGFRRTNDSRPNNPLLISELVQPKNITLIVQTKTGKQLDTLVTAPQPIIYSKEEKQQLVIDSAIIDASSHGAKTVQFYEPGYYQISVWYKNQKIISKDICLPTYTPVPLKPKPGDVTCNGYLPHPLSSNSLDEASVPYILTIGDPIFIKGANNDIAQFNTPLLYILMDNPNNETKVTESLQTVIYKKNELQKVEDTASLESQNILYNTQSLWNYQWTGLVPENEYVIYFYDKATGSKSSYINLVWGKDGKWIASTVSSLPAWTENVTKSVVAIGGTKIVFADPSADEGDARSVTVTSAVNYANTKRTGKVSDARVVLRLYNIDSTGAQTLNTEEVQSVAPVYNQDTKLAKRISGLIPGQKYAVQFVDPANGNAASTARVIEAKDGKFGIADDQSLITKTTAADDSTADQSSSEKTLLHNPLKDGLDSIPAIIAAVVDDIVIPIAIPFLALAIIYTGFLFVQARGNSTKLEEAKKALQWTLIGGALILGAYVIATAIQSTIANIVR